MIFFCAHCDEVPALSKLLSSDRLCEPATQVLVAISSDITIWGSPRARPGPNN